MVTDELLRRAIFDPARVRSRQAGLLIDVEDLRAALERLVTPDTLDAAAVDASLVVFSSRWQKLRQLRS
jgi:hypothetical protein